MDCFKPAFHSRPPFIYTTSSTFRPPYYGRSDNDDNCCHTLAVTSESKTVRALQKEKMGVYREEEEDDLYKLNLKFDLQ